jgi:hypothetical protein
MAPTFVKIEGKTSGPAHVVIDSAAMPTSIALFPAPESPYCKKIIL